MSDFGGFCGRSFEYCSEDALLSGKLGAAMVRGHTSQGAYAFGRWSIGQ